MSASRLPRTEGFFVIDPDLVNAKQAVARDGRLHLSPAMYRLVAGAADTDELFRLFRAMGVDTTAERWPGGRPVGRPGGR